MNHKTVFIAIIIYIGVLQIIARGVTIQPANQKRTEPRTDASKMAPFSRV